MLVMHELSSCSALLALELTADDCKRNNRKYSITEEKLFETKDIMEIDFCKI